MYGCTKKPTSGLTSQIALAVVSSRPSDIRYGMSSASPTAQPSCDGMTGMHSFSISQLLSRSDEGEEADASVVDGEEDERPAVEVTVVAMEGVGECLEMSGAAMSLSVLLSSL